MKQYFRCIISQIGKCVIYNGMTISPKELYYREKEHCATFIRAHLMWDLQLGLGLS